ncbi:hypothetical protein MMC20_003148 [Loxospora ochrophaea]|nr:hypothetical protein [Loxospora ochrophaea]
MPLTQTYSPHAPSSIPLAVSSKSPYRHPVAQSPSYTRVAVSPPKAGSTPNASAVPSLTSGSYAGSSKGDYESSGGAANVDLVEMMNNRVSNAVNPLPMDRSLAKQAQTSGQLNAKQRELAELQALAQRRLKGARANIADGMKAAKEVKKDLEWTQKRMTGLKAKTERKIPSAYKTASGRYPAPVDC